MAKHLILGQKGEDIAARYLEQHGYLILDRNWRSGHKELDLVVLKESTVVFVEVKTRTCTDYGDPWNFVDERKISRIVRSADAYIRFRCIDLDVRFDIISITIEDGDFKIEHIEDAFLPTVE
ncbi:MAG: YraN family protein [Bacteroidaceae bacterium]